MSEASELQRAKFTPQTGPLKGTEIDVHFNPVSLQYTVVNTLEAGRGNDKKQYVGQSTGKLNMDLVFDTTHNGQDVRVITEKIAGFMQPDENKIPAIVQFEWGTYKFQGMIESYKETLDFFAPNGVPLRATINLALAKQDKVFEPSAANEGAPPPGPVDLPRGSGDDVTNAATRAGNPQAARGIAAANGQENMRFPSGASLTMSASVSLKGPVSFASNGGSGIKLGASAGAGSGNLRVGGGLSAGVSASAGAFAGLRTATQGGRVSVKLDPNRLVPPSPPSVNLATDRGASFSMGGKANLEGSASLSADVGATASLHGRIVFEE